MRKLVLLSVILGCVQLFATPPTSCDPVIHNYSGWMERHNSKLALIKRYGSTVQIGFFGDSITHFFEETGAVVWRQYFEGTPYRAIDFGYGGDMTEHVLWRMENGELDGYKAKALVLMIGTNNAGARSLYLEPAGDTVLGISKCIDLMKEKQPQAVIILCSITPRGTDDSDIYRKRNDVVNKEIVKLCDGKQVIWCDWGNQMLEPDGTLPVAMCSTDYLHPTVKGYRVWVKNLLPIFANIIDNPNPNFCVAPVVRQDKAWWDALADRRAQAEGSFDVVFLGDSFLNGFYSKAPDARKKIVGEGTEFDLTFQGDLVQNVLWRAKFGELTGYAAGNVVICAGSANTNNAPEEVAAGVTVLVEAAKKKQKNARILVTPIMPMGREKDSPVRKWVDETNDLLIRGLEGDNVYVVDPASVLLDEGGRLPEAYSEDGIELTEAGYEAWGGLIKEWIKSHQ